MQYVGQTVNASPRKLQIQQNYKKRPEGYDSFLKIPLEKPTSYKRF